VGGINAGVILLQPREKTHAPMLQEVTSEAHPEHVPGNGPEQDYFSRYFASSVALLKKNMVVKQPWTSWTAAAH